MDLKNLVFGVDLSNDLLIKFIKNLPVDFKGIKIALVE
jgi:hypothetical protein